MSSAGQFSKQVGFSGLLDHDLFDLRSNYLDLPCFQNVQYTLILSRFGDLSDYVSISFTWCSTFYAQGTSIEIGKFLTKKYHLWKIIGYRLAVPPTSPLHILIVCELEQYRLLVTCSVGLQQTYRQRGGGHKPSAQKLHAFSFIFSSEKQLFPPTKKRILSQQFSTPSRKLRRIHAKDLQVFTKLSSRFIPKHRAQWFLFSLLISNYINIPPPHMLPSAVFY